MTPSDIQLAGCYTALVTPFTESGQLDTDRLREQVTYQIEKGPVAGFVPCGTTGESPTLSQEEWELVISTVVELAQPHNLPVIAGTGSNNTAHAVELHSRAAELGATAGLSVNPYYNKPTQEGLCRHFTSIADSNSGLPVVLYNIPGRTGVRLETETIARLADHPKIIAIKDATGSTDSISEMIQLGVDTKLTILSGDDSMTLPFAILGARGAVSVVSNIYPDQVQNLCIACNKGEWPTARQIHDQLFRLCKGLLTLSTNPIPIKTAMKLMNRDSGTLRLPLCEPTSTIVEKIQNILHN